MQLPEYARQFLARYVKERGVGEYAIEESARQVQREKILVQDFAAAVLARHGGEARGAVKPDHAVPERLEGLQVAPRSAAEIKDREGRSCRDVPQQRIDVLADIVIGGARAKILGALLVMRKGALAQPAKVTRIERRRIAFGFAAHSGVQGLHARIIRGRPPGP